MHKQLQTMKKMSTRLISPTPSRGIKSSEDMPSPDVRELIYAFELLFQIHNLDRSIETKKSFPHGRGTESGMCV
jgi:hypothetical protein